MNRREELMGLAERWNDAWNSHDATQLADFFAETGSYYEPDMLTGPVPGAPGVRDAAEKTWNDWPQASFSIVSVTVEDPRIVLEWRSNAVHRSGVEVQLEGIDLLEVTGEKISSARVYYDIHRREQALAGGG